MLDNTEKKKERRTEKKREKRKQNALVHGFYARDALLPWDNRSDYEQLHQELCAEFRPFGAAEKETVLDLTNAFWLKRTIWRMRQATVMADPLTAGKLERECDSWAELRKHYRKEASAGRSFQHLAMKTITELRVEVQRSQREIDEAADREQVEVAKNKMAACLELLAERAAPLLTLIAKFPNAEKSFDNAYVPESIDKLVTLEAKLDARIAKILARLVGLKEFKKTPAGGGGDGGAAEFLLDRFGHHQTLRLY